MPNTSTLPVPAESWAEVRTGDQVMRYRRSGTGPTVLLLQSSSDSRAFWPGFTEALAGHFRIIEPDLPTDQTDVARWVTGFLEGLGLASVAVVATDSFCIPTLELALLGTDQISRAVLVPDGEAEATGLDGTLATSMRDAAVALLVVRRGMPAPVAVPMISGFLAGEGVPVPG